MNNLEDYITCALWSSTDHNDIQLDEGLYELADETRQRMKEDLDAFTTLADEHVPEWRDYWSPEQFAHDFWLTRCGHGAGFWCRYSPNDEEGTRVGEALSELSRKAGNVDLYVGDDLIYQFPHR